MSYKFSGYECMCERDNEDHILSQDDAMKSTNDAGMMKKKN